VTVYEDYLLRLSLGTKDFDQHAEGHVHIRIVLFCQLPSICYPVLGVYYESVSSEHLVVCRRCYILPRRRRTSFLVLSNLSQADVSISCVYAACPSDVDQ
jgi:hypothetical protein